MCPLYITVQFVGIFVFELIAAVCDTICQSWFFIYCFYLCKMLSDMCKMLCVLLLYFIMARLGLPFIKCIDNVYSNALLQRPVRYNLKHWRLFSSFLWCGTCMRFVLLFYVFCLSSYELDRSHFFPFIIFWLWWLISVAPSAGMNLLCQLWMPIIYN